MIVYGSGIGDGNRHNHDDLPILVAGQGGGTLKTGPAAMQATPGQRRGSWRKWAPGKTTQRPVSRPLDFERVSEGVGLLAR